MNYAPQCSTALHQLSISHWMAPRSFGVFRFQNEISTLSEKKKKKVLQSYTELAHKKLCCEPDLLYLMNPERGKSVTGCSQKM